MIISTGLVKGIGLATTVAGMGVTLVSEWVSDKKMDQKIEEQVTKALLSKNL